MKPAVVFEKVNKIYYPGWWSRSGLHAVCDVSLEIPRGTIFGLLGPNRAGKTTLVKMLLGLTRPTSGAITRLEQPLKNKSVLSKIGYMHENQHFPRYLTASELLRFYGALTLVPTQLLDKRADALLEQVGLSDRRYEPIGQFSKGMVQRLALAQALINEPDLLVLDEPAEGLDLFGRSLLRDVIKERKAKGGTVLLVSHVLNEAEQICDEVGVIFGGKLIRRTSLTELLKDKQGKPRTLEVALQRLYENAKP